MDDPSTPEVSQPHVVGPPVRRRLPVLKIAAVVLAVLVGGLWWRSRPNLDPRFVGTWEYFQVSDPQRIGNPDPSDALGTLTFGTDGLAREDDDPASVGWHVSGDKLYVTPRPNSLDESIELGKYAMDQLAQGSMPTLNTTLRIQDVGGQRIVLRVGDEPDAAYLILKRVPPADPVP